MQRRHHKLPRSRMVTSPFSLLVRIPTVQRSTHKNTVCRIITRSVAPPIEHRDICPDRPVRLIWARTTAQQSNASDRARQGVLRQLKADCFGCVRWGRGQFGRKREVSPRVPCSEGAPRILHFLRPASNRKLLRRNSCMIFAEPANARIHVPFD